MLGRRKVRLSKWVVNEDSLIHPVSTLCSVNDCCISDQEASDRWKVQKSLKFEEALKLNNLGERIEQRYGRWGHFTEENAKTVVKVSDLEVGQGVKSVSFQTMAMLAFTWVNESSWHFRPEPNTNGKPESPWNWDIGPFQLNVQWTHRIAWQQDFKTKDLSWKEVFGQQFYLEDEITPAPFNGDVVTHGRCALRRLLHDQRQAGPLGFPDRETMRVVLYTGPKAQPARLKAWNEYGEDFKRFFDAYTSD